MEDKQYLIEAIIPSAKNVAANLGLKGKNIAQWDSIVNNIITAINNDSYNPTSTYITPKKGVFGYSQESLQSIADQMVAQIKSTKKTTSDLNTSSALKGSKYKNVYDYNEEWNDGYNSESIFKRDNAKTFDALITNVTQALNEVQALDNTTLLKGFKGKKENINNIKKELNSLKGDFNEDNYNKFINILGNLGIDSSKINTYFQSETGTQESNTFITNPSITSDTLPIKYNDTIIQYYDDPFSDNYGKIIYGDKTYNNLNDLYKATKDSELIKTINEKIKSDNDRFKSYDLNNLTGFYDLTFDDNGKYYDVTNVYGPTEDYKYILAKTDDINKFNWKSDNDFYGVTNDGKIVKIQNPSELLNNPNWYNITYDPKNFKTLLNAQYLAGLKPTKHFNLLQTIEKPGLVNDLSVTNKGNVIRDVWNFNKPDTVQKAAKIYIDNFDTAGAAFLRNVVAKERNITDSDIKEFLLNLYEAVKNDNEYTTKVLDLIKNSNISFNKMGGIIKGETGTKSTYAQTLQSNAEQIDKDEDQASYMLDGAMKVGDLVYLTRKSNYNTDGSLKANKFNKAQIINLVGNIINGTKDGEYNKEDLVQTVKDLSIQGARFLPKKWRQMAGILFGLGEGYSAIKDGENWQDKALGVGNAVISGYLTAKAPSSKHINNIKGKKFSFKNLFKRNTASKPTASAGTAAEVQPGVPMNKFGGPINYLKIF